MNPRSKSSRSGPESVSDRVMSVRVNRPAIIDATVPQRAADDSTPTLAPDRRRRESR